VLRRFALLAILFPAVAACGAPARPNILLVVLDTARADRFPFQGYERPTAPNLAALARQGVAFTNVFSPAPWTVPAHASLFTGQYPSLHRTDCGSLRLPDAAVTLAETLRDAGYRTLAYSANPWIGSTYNFRQGFDTFEEIWRRVPPGSEDTGASLNNERVGRFLRWRQENREARRQPFFMFINYFEPHIPYHPPEPERSRLLRPGTDRARAERLSRLGHPDEMRFILGLSDLTAADLLILSDLYDGEIAYVDRRLGEVIADLRDLGLLDGTVVAVAGDHGENLGDHGLMDHKMSVHDTLLRVPVVLRYPPRIAPGRVVDRPVQMHDLYPTLLGLAGVEAPEGVTIEAVPLPETGVEGSRRPEGDPIVGEFVGPPVDFLAAMEEAFPGTDLSRFDRKLVALRLDGYKIQWGSDGRHALYDVAADPGESRDLAVEDPVRLARMAEAVRRWLDRPQRAGPHDREPAPAEVSRAGRRAPPV
jgi:arylsulfatase A-like enzyme